MYAFNLLVIDGHYKFCKGSSLTGIDTVLIFGSTLLSLLAISSTVGSINSRGAPQKRVNYL